MYCHMSRQFKTYVMSNVFSYVYLRLDMSSYTCLPFKKKRFLNEKEAATDQGTTTWRVDCSSPAWPTVEWVCQATVSLPSKVSSVRQWSRRLSHPGQSRCRWMFIFPMIFVCFFQADGVAQARQQKRYWMWTLPNFSRLKGLYSVGTVRPEASTCLPRMTLPWLPGSTTSRSTSRNISRSALQKTSKNTSIYHQLRMDEEVAFTGGTSNHTTFTLYLWNWIVQSGDGEIFSRLAVQWGDRMN